MKEPSNTNLHNTILVVDDEKHINNALVHFLTVLGYRVVAAFDGEEALQLILQNKPDLILLDVVMPKKNGFDVCRTVRSREDTRNIPIIMLTTLSDQRDRIKGIEAGCDEFAQKPVSFEELKIRIKSLLKINYYRSMVNEKEKFEMIVHAVHDGIFVLDNRLKVTNANPFGLRLLNLTPVTVKELDIIDYIKSNFVVDASCNLKEPRGNNDVVFEISRPESGSVQGLFLFAGMQYLYDPDGKLSSAILTVRDVTEFKKEEKVKRNFISLISHKLLTPLTVVLGNQYLLKEKGYANFNEYQKRLVEHTLNKTEQLNQLIQKLLLFVEVYAGSFNDQKEDIRVGAFVQGAVKRYFSEKQKSDIQYDIDVQCEDRRVNMITRHLELIVTNLLDNTIIHNNKKEKKVTIKLGNSRTNGREYASIIVEDNGAGIPNEEYSNIFDTFYQVEKCFTGQKKGFGLGLAMVKQLVEQYGGTIGVTSKLDQGSVFTICLPHAP